MALAPGSWVRSYSKGIWQAVRVVPEHYAPRYSLDDPKTLADGPTYVLKRLVDDKWKRAFATECAHASFVKPIPKSDQAKLAKLLAGESTLLAEFEAFDRPVDASWNLPFSLPRKSDFAKFRKEAEGALATALSDGLTGDRILGMIASTGFADRLRRMPVGASLRFSSVDHEVQNRELIFRRLEVQAF